jgi:hypothetical protein
MKTTTTITMKEKKMKITKRETVFKNVRIDYTCEITHITHNWSKYVAKFTAQGSYLVMAFNTVDACHKFFDSQIEKLELV